MTTAARIMDALKRLDDFSLRSHPLAHAVGLGVTELYNIQRGQLMGRIANKFAQQKFANNPHVIHLLVTESAMDVVAEWFGYPIGCMVS